MPSRPRTHPAHWYAPHIRLLPPPDDYRGPYGANEPDAGERYAALADPLIADLERRRLWRRRRHDRLGLHDQRHSRCAEGLCAGRLWSACGAAGGLFIADEVQSGFGRMGTAFWGHRHHGVVPDFITIGKPAGNGHPVGAVITQARDSRAFHQDSVPSSRPSAATMSPVPRGSPCST